MNRVYCANGFIIVSDITLVGWEEKECFLDNSSFIRIHFYKAKLNTQYKEGTWPYIYVDQLGLIFNWENRIAMCVRDEQTPICVEYQIVDSTIEIELTFALNFILSYIAHRYNRIVLHGCCYADIHDKATIILGESGYGKSTLLYRVLNNGYRFISEEICFVNIGERIETFTSNRIIRLNADVYNNSAGDILYDNSDSKITFWNPEYKVETGSVLLGSIIFLEKSETENECLEKLCVSEALNLVLKKYLYTKSVVKRISLGDLCESIARMLKATKIYKYKYKGYPSYELVLHSM